MKRAVLIIAALLSFGAMLPSMPYSYFMLVRVAVCAASITAAVDAFERGRTALAWPCVAMAILFNPVIKVHLTRDLWWWFDGAAAVWLLIVAVRQRAQPLR